MKKHIKKSVTTSLYNPHNYRLYFNFTKKNYKPKQGMVGVWFGKFKNHQKEFTATGEGTRVTIKKTQVELINKLTEEEWFLVNRAKAKEEIQAICAKIDDKCIKGLKRFIEVYGGECNFILLKRECRALLKTKSDNKVMKEPFIDTLPLDMVFETDIVKKVYKKPNVEFKEPIYAANYLENSALKEFAPEISTQLDKMNAELKGLLYLQKEAFRENNNVLKALREQISSHLSLIQEYREEAEQRSKPFFIRWIDFFRKTRNTK